MTNHDLLETIADDLEAERVYNDPTVPTVDAFDLFDTKVDGTPKSGEVYLRLFRPQYDPEGVKISHRAGNFGRVRLLMRGAVLFLNRDQTTQLLSQWRRLTHQRGLASGWTIQRRYFSDIEDAES